MIFSQGNAKLRKLAKDKGIPNAHVVSFDLPAGHTCPGAKDCLSKAGRNGEGLKDGKDTKFRCYAASSEAVYKQTRAMRWKNLDAVRLALRKSIKSCSDKLLASIPKQAKIIRIHTSGDFFSVKYMQAWMKVCEAKPNIQFYAYTKSLKILSKVGEVPKNLHINLSHGGKFDSLLVELNHPVVHVVSDELIALNRGLKVDSTDGIACSNNISDFALVIHGVQPKGGHSLAMV